MTIYYKVLDKRQNSPYGRDLQWKLPRPKKDGTYTPGGWMPAVPGDLILCNNGYHVTELKDLVCWLNQHIYLAEISAEHLDGHDKTVARRIRLLAPTPWDDRRARLFAADCAEYVLGIYERAYPNDDRPRKAIEAARLLATGQITAYAAYAAVAYAAYAAADAAAYTAAYAAYAAADAAAYTDAAAYAAAADAAAAAAARLAARAAGGGGGAAAVRMWQVERLALYLLPELPDPMPPIIGYGQEGGAV